MNALALVLFMGTATPPEAPPSIPSVVVTHSPGACTSPVTSATRTVSWSLHFTGTTDPADFGTKVYKDGVLMATRAANLSDNFVETLTGLVEHGPVGSFSETVTFRIDVYNLRSGVVVVSKSAAPFSMTYGECAGGGGLH